MRYLIFLFATCFLISCKKSEQAPFQSYLRMTVDGTRSIAADANISASGPSPDGSSILMAIRGSWGTGRIEIDLYGFRETTGQTMVTSTLASLRFSLYDPGSTRYYAGDRGLLGGQDGTGQINIIEVSREYVKGTFEFQTTVNNFTGEKRTVTGGEFHIKRGY